MPIDKRRTWLVRTISVAVGFVLGIGMVYVLLLVSPDLSPAIYLLTPAIAGLAVVLLARLYALASGIWLGGLVCVALFLYLFSGFGTLPN